VTCGTFGVAAEQSPVAAVAAVAAAMVIAAIL